MAAPRRIRRERDRSATAIPGAGGRGDSRFHRGAECGSDLRAAAGADVMSESILGSALAFARHGHAVFPLHWPVEHNGQVACSCGRLCGKNAAKHPIARYAPHGHLSATTDTGIIKLLFGLRVPEANLAVATQTLLVLDIDPPPAT